MKQLGKCSALVVLACLTSCAQHYGPAMFGTQNTNMAKPQYDTGTANRKSYAGLEFSGNNGYNSSKYNYSLMPSYHRAHAFSFLDVAYGGFGYAGLYRVSNIKPENGIKYFAGLGGRASANVNLRLENFNWRIIGVDAAYSKEFGSYRQMRSDFNNNSNDSIIMYHTKGHSASIGLFTEFVFRQDDDEYWSIKLSAGKQPSFGNNNADQGSDVVGNYFRAGATTKVGPAVIGYSYFLTVGYSSKLFRQGFILSAQLSIQEAFQENKEFKPFN